MKKLIALLISGVIMLPCVNAFANDVIEVYIDGEKLECDVNPKNIETANLYACLLIIKL